MSAPADGLSDDLTGLLVGSLERERQLGRTYRQQIQCSWSPRVRRLWEDGWAVKRGHDEALTRLLRAHKGTPPETAALMSTPSPREVLSWAYEQERVLALDYQESARLADAPEAHQVLDRLGEEQRRFVARVRETYRDYSAA